MKPVSSAPETFFDGSDASVENQDEGFGEDFDDFEEGAQTGTDDEFGDFGDGFEGNNEDDIATPIEAKAPTIDQATPSFVGQLLHPKCLKLISL